MDTSSDTIQKHATNIITQALNEDQDGKLVSALALYMQGLQLLMLVVQNETNETKNMSLRVQIGQIMDRAESIKNRIKLEESQNSQTNDNTKTTDTVDNTIQNTEIEDHKNWKLILKIDKVKCYVINSEGHQTDLLSDNSLLQLIKDDKVDDKVLLCIGSNFGYDLNESIPCLSVKTGHYILPGIGGISYGIIFPDDIPLIFCSVFEEQLSHYCTLKKSTTLPSEIEEPGSDDETATGKMITPRNQQSAEKIEGEEDVNNQLTIFGTLQNNLTALINDISLINVAKSIDFTGKAIVQGITSGRDLFQSGIQQGGVKLKENLQPTEKPVEIPATIRTTLAIAKAITPHFVNVSGSIVSGVAGLIGIGNTSNQNRNAVQSNKQNQSAVQSGGAVATDSTIGAVKQIGKAGVVAVVSVWTSLEEAGISLLGSTGSVAADVISHKFGEEAGKAARDGFGVAHDILRTTEAIQSLGPKTIAKKLVKDRTRTAAKNFFGSHSSESGATTEFPTIDQPPETHNAQKDNIHIEEVPDTHPSEQKDSSPPAKCFIQSDDEEPEKN